MQLEKKLIGRALEIEKLDKMLHAKQADFLAVYGRRRVGKTFLIRQHLKPNIIFDLSGKKEGELQEQLDNFFEEYIKRTKSKKIKQAPTTWQEAFKLLTTYISSLPKKKTKYVIFLDEMPWMDTPKSKFISALDFFWNQHASNMDNVLLIACGSATSWIRKKLIQARGGLHNRVTQRMKLIPFTLHETDLYIKSCGIKMPQYQILELYMAMGGIPFYLKEITRGKTATQLIDDICFSKQGLLQGEYEQLYHSLFKNADNHIVIIEALAKKPQGITRADIAAVTKLSEGTLSRTLEELCECDFVSIYMPFINKKKDAIYKLTDLYSLFYLKFIKPNKGGGNKTWEQLSKQTTYKAWSGYAFENICMAHTQQIKTALGISGIYTQTSAWKFRGNDTLPGAQIDMVIDRADQAINICEAKFTKENFVVTKKYSEELRAKKTIFKTATKTKKLLFTTLLSTYPVLKNNYYLEEIDNEITMDILFEAAK
jgi:uncharacterized protein